jgi:hypothetical protein
MMGAAQTEVTTYTPGVTAEGITYFLPRTESVIRVTATVTHYIPGDFRPYAERYLRLNDIPREAYDSWQIDNVSIYSIGTPDENKVFSVKLRQKTSAPLVSLTHDGILLSINAEEKDNNVVPAAPAPVKTSTKLNPRDYMTQEILAAGSVSKMAELTAAEIYDIRESRSSLAKGEADNMPKDGEQLKLMMNGLDTQEKALLPLLAEARTGRGRQSRRRTRLHKRQGQAHRPRTPTCGQEEKGGGRCALHRAVGRRGESVLLRHYLRHGHISRRPVRQHRAPRPRALQQADGDAGALQPRHGQCEQAQSPPALKRKQSNAEQS